jgi:hypothetical protein
MSVHQQQVAVNLNVVNKNLQYSGIRKLFRYFIIVSGMV